MIEITYDVALSALNDAVKKYGAEFVYEKGMFTANDGGDMFASCAYLHADADGNLTEPGCIVGHALVGLGVSTEPIKDYNVGMNADDMLRILAERGCISYTNKAKALLNTVQGYQDEGMPWGEAIVLSVERIHRIKWDSSERQIYSDGYLKNVVSI